MVAFLAVCASKKSFGPFALMCPLEQPRLGSNESMKIICNALIIPLEVEDKVKALNSLSPVLTAFGGLRL